MECTETMEGKTLPAFFPRHGQQFQVQTIKPLANNQPLHKENVWAILKWVGLPGGIYTGGVCPPSSQPPEAEEKTCLPHAVICFVHHSFQISHKALVLLALQKLQSYAFNN